MRSPSAKFKKPHDVHAHPETVDLPRPPVYVGSPEHKDHVTREWRRPQPRSDASLCPILDSGIVRTWLAEALRRGWFSAFMEGGFPRYAWYVAEGQWYEARLTNQGLGQYKGYPVQETDVPRALRRPA